MRHMPDLDEVLDPEDGLWRGHRYEQSVPHPQWPGPVRGQRRSLAQRVAEEKKRTAENKVWFDAKVRRILGTDADAFLRMVDAYELGGKS